MSGSRKLEVDGTADTATRMEQPACEWTLEIGIAEHVAVLVGPPEPSSQIHIRQAIWAVVVEIHPLLNTLQVLQQQRQLF